MTDYASIKRKLLLSPGALFEDKDFPASNSSLYLRAPWSSARVEWKRPRELVDNPKFVVQGVVYMDLEQGELGNCWFVAATAALAASDWKLLHRVVPQDQSFDVDYAGIFRFQFWQSGQWKEVVVDDRLPTRYGKLIYSSNNVQKNEFWVALLEKAYAKLYGCYEAIDGGRVHDALLDLTGGITELIDLKGISSDKLIPIMTACDEMDTIMGGAIFGTGVREGPRNNGLYEQHAYSIIRLKTVEFRGRKTTLLLMRNPFGQGEWNGPWSDRSIEWSEVTRTDREDEAFLRRDNGEFWISVEDFIANFDELEMCHLSLDAMTDELIRSPGNRKQWKKVEFSGRWIRGVSAGGPLNSFTSSWFWMNPQFRMKLEDRKQAYSVVISLIEITDKVLKSSGEVSIGFVIFKLKPGREPVGKLTGDNFYEHTPQLVDTSGTFWPYRERALHFVLDSGSYIIVPCTFKRNMEGEFYLRIFSETAAAAEPVEEPLGPTEVSNEIGVEPTDLIEKLFLKHQAHDGRVDAFDLYKILDEAKREEYGKTDGYSLETCRCLVSLLDTNVSGTLALDKVKTAWMYVRMWTSAFKSADISEDNTVDSLELAQMYKKIGFVLDTETMRSIVRRYGGREGKIHEDDFLQSFCRVLALYQIFKKKSSSSGKITLNLSEWLSSSLYV